MRLRGATVLLTGATGGIGQAIARALRAEGAELILTGRRADVLAGLAEETSARVVTADLGSPAELERLVAEAGPVDGLVANAALPGAGHLLDLDVAEIDANLDVNLRAPIVLTRLLAPGMAERGRGHITFISSLSGLAAAGETSMYSATKFGLRGFAHSARQDLHAAGVGVSVVLPGFVREAGMFVNSGVRLPKAIRTSTPEQVAAAVVRSIVRNRAELLVAPPELRVGALIGTLVPGLAGPVQRRFGGDRIARQLSEGHRRRPD